MSKPPRESLSRGRRPVTSRLLHGLGTIAPARGPGPGATTMPLTIEVEQEDDGRWLAEVPDIPGALAYGPTRSEAIERVQALALRVLADRLDHGEPVPQMSSVFAVTPRVGGPRTKPEGPSLP